MASKKRSTSELERVFVDIVIEMSKNDAEVARKAWLDSPDPGRKMQHLTQKEGMNPRQYLRLEDVYRLSVGLGVSLPMIILAAMNRLHGLPGVAAATDDEKSILA